MADILHSIQISAPAATVYSLASTPAGLAKWWAADVSEPDGAVELGFFNHQTVYRLKQQVQQPPGTSGVAVRNRTGMEWHASGVPRGVSRRQHATPLYARRLAIGNRLLRFV